MKKHKIKKKISTRFLILGIILILLSIVSLVITLFKPNITIKNPELVFITPGRFAPDRPTDIFRRNLETSSSQLIFTIPTSPTIRLANIKLSPDGKKIAYTIMEFSPTNNSISIASRLWLLDTHANSSQTPKLLYESKSLDGPIDLLDWSPDSENLLFYADGDKHLYNLDTKNGKLKMTALSGYQGVYGWFTNNKIGFAQPKPNDDCPPEDECYPQYKAVLANPDGSNRVVAYDPPAKDGLEEYFWLKDGSGMVKVNRVIKKTISHYDLTSKKMIDILKFSGNEGITDDLIMFPNSKAALILVDDQLNGNDDMSLYKIDLTSNTATKIKTYDRFVELEAISYDEKYYFISYGNNKKGDTTLHMPEVYNMQGELVGNAPYDLEAQPIGYAH